MTPNEHYQHLLYLQHLEFAARNKKEVWWLSLLPETREALTLRAQNANNVYTGEAELKAWILSLSQ